MSRLSEMAKAKMNGCALMTGREKAETITDEIVTLTDIDIIKSEKGDFAVYLVKEENGKYFNGGQAITELGKEIVSDEELMTDLHTNGLKVRFSKTKTRSGRDFTSVEVFD